MMSKAQKLSETFNSSRSEIEKICQISGVPGVSVLVIDQGEIIHSDNVGFSNLANKTPVTSDTIFHIASMTKSFTAACINRLRVEGKLKLDDTIQKILLGARSRDPVVAEFGTVADLLGHRTGLQRADSMWRGAEGELMFELEQTTAVFNQLRSVQSLRSKFMYNNICFAMLGEIIAKLTGQSYHEYLKQNILDPLGMTRSMITKAAGLPDNASLAYSALADATPFNVPLPGISASGTLGAAGGLMSTANDLSKYYKALMKSWTAQTTPSEGTSNVVNKDLLFDDISWLFSPLQIMDLPIVREKSYASGWVRSQLPGKVGDIGVNPGLIDEMPLLAEGIDSRLAFWHQGSLVGDTSFVMLLPETESAVVVLTNSMALNNAADWIGQLLVEKLLDSPIRHDYVHLASLSAKRAVEKYEELTNELEAGKEPSKPPKDLAKYAGSYVGVGGVFLIDVALVEGSLELRLQGRKSQAFRLHHYRDDVFSWFLTFDDQIKRGLFVVYDPEYYLISFKSEEETGFKVLNWANDRDVAEGEDFYRLGDGQSRVDSGISL
jgi:CubicO group peptidase (beta-lactamase class C family)